MNKLLMNCSRCFLMVMLALLLIEILAVGCFVAGWCLNTAFGPFAFVVVAVGALAAAWTYHLHREKKTNGRLL